MSAFIGLYERYANRRRSFSSSRSCGVRDQMFSGGRCDERLFRFLLRAPISGRSDKPGETNSTFRKPRH